MGRGIGFFRAGSDRILPISGIRSVDTGRLLQCEVAVRHDAGDFLVTGTDAIELIYLIKPSALEGCRLRWIKNAWVLHNMVGHPGMQILAWLGKPKWGIWLHDITTPRPQGRR